MRQCSLSHGIMDLLDVSFMGKIKSSLAEIRRFWRWLCCIFNTESGDYLFLMVIISAYSGIVLSKITKFAFWADEAFSAYMIQFDFLKIAKLTALDVHPPLYYWALKVWTHIFGTTEVGIRSLSLFFTCLVIITTYFFIKYIYNRSAAHFVSIALLIAPLLFRYSQEARMYTMMIFFAVLSTFLLVVADSNKTKKKYWTLYGIISGIGMLVHYMLGLTILSQWIWRYVDTKYVSKNDRFFEKGFVMSICYMFTTVLVWLPFLLSQFFLIQSRGFWPSKIIVKDFIDFFSSTFVYVPLGDLPWPGWLGVSVVLFCAYLVIKKNVASRVFGDKYSTLIYIVCFLPLFLLVILSMPPFKPVFISRYLICSSFFIYMLFAISFSKLWRRNLFVFVSGILVFLAMAVGVYSINNVTFSNDPDASNSNIRDLALEIKETNVSAPIITNNYGIFFECHYYAHTNNEMYFIGSDIYRKFGSYSPLRDSTHEIKDLDGLEKKFKKFWYVVPASSSDPTLDDVPRPKMEWAPIITIKKFNDKTNETGFIATLFVVGDL